MSSHKYTLEPYKGIASRFRCPSCQDRSRTFSRYIHTDTGDYVCDDVGRCNRESKCGYHYTPKQYFEDNNIRPNRLTGVGRSMDSFKIPQTSFVDFEIFKASLNISAFDRNCFVQYLISIFGEEIAEDLVKQYYIGNSKHWYGASVFWQIDSDWRIRTGKIMLYDPLTGKRVKDPYNHINWVHSVLNKPQFNLRQCFFGEHLIKNNSKPIAVVESEKTAVIARGYIPEFIWLASGSLSSLTDDKCMVLAGRDVTLFPDLNGFEKWEKRASELSHIASFRVSDLLERNATHEEKASGLDIADYLIRFNVYDFRTQEVLTRNLDQRDSENITKTVTPFNAFQSNNEFLEPHKEKKESWVSDILELSNYFLKVQFPDYPVSLDSSTTINDCRQFVESHLSVVTANEDKRIFRPYLDRLLRLKEIFLNDLGYKNQ